MNKENTALPGRLKIFPKEFISAGYRQVRLFFQANLFILNKITMKTILLIIAFFLLTFGWANSQQIEFAIDAEEVLDSVITWKFSGSSDSTLSFRIVYGYDNENRIILQTEDLREPATRAWAPYRKVQYNYDEWDNQVLWSIMFYENEYAAFVGLLREENTFDASGKKLQSTWYSWDTDVFDWGNQIKTDFEYNNLDSLAWTYTTKWNKQTEQYDSTAKVHYTYQPGGKLQQTIEWEPDESALVLYPATKHEYEYNNSANKILDSKSIYNPNTGIWYPVVKGEFEYDFNNKKIKETYYEYNETTEYWMPKEMYDYAWNSAGLMTHYAEYRINEDTIWATKRKQEMEYSDSYKILKENYYSGNNEGGWTWNGKREYLYSGQDLLTEITLSEWNEAAGDWKLLNQYKYVYDSLSRTYNKSYYTWINILHRLELTTRDYYYYSENQSVGIAEQKEDMFLIYPNPASEILNLRSGDFGFNTTLLEIFDYNGRKLLERTVAAGNKNTEIDVSSLKNGFYLTRIQFKNQIITKKIVIQK
jgi:hypothetical protein